jgi:hypothetical protein
MPSSALLLCIEMGLFHPTNSIAVLISLPALDTLHNSRRHSLAQQPHMLWSFSLAAQGHFICIFPPTKGIFINFSNLPARFKPPIEHEPLPLGKGQKGNSVDHRAPAKNGVLVGCFPQRSINRKESGPDEKYASISWSLELKPFTTLMLSEPANRMRTDSGVSVEPSDKITASLCQMLDLMASSRRLLSIPFLKALYRRENVKICLHVLRFEAEHVQNLCAGL